MGMMDNRQTIIADELQSHLDWIRADLKSALNQLNQIEEVVEGVVKEEKVYTKDEVADMLTKMLLEFEKNLCCNKQCKGCKKVCNAIPGIVIIHYFEEKINELKENNNSDKCV